MSEKGFIKLMREAEELFDKDIDAFVILTQMAFRSRRSSSKYDSDNLKANESLIGDHEKLKMSDRRYRDAKERVEHKYKLGTFKGTNKGTIATLTTTEIYDINSIVNDEQKDDQRTSQGRAEDELRTTNKECKNIKNERTQQTGVVFSCLEKIQDSSITQKHKIEITAKYSAEEQIVIDAVETITCIDFHPSGSMLQSLRAACKGKWKPNPKPIDFFERNKSIAKKLEKIGHQFYQFVANEKYLEIIKGHISAVVEYEKTAEFFDSQVQEKANINLNEHLNQKQGIV